MQGECDTKWLVVIWKGEGKSSSHMFKELLSHLERLETHKRQTRVTESYISALMWVGFQ